MAPPARRDELAMVPSIGRGLAQAAARTKTSVPADLAVAAAGTTDRYRPGGRPMVEWRP